MTKATTEKKKQLGNGWSKRTKIALTILWVGFFVGATSIVILFNRIAQGKIGYMPAIEELENPKNKFASEIYSSDMEVLGRYFQSQENRVFVNYNQLSPYLVQALIATEDARFTEHSGIDLTALMRVFVKRVIMGQKNAGGGSTITQQLAKQLYSPQANNILERFLQKPIEWVIAVQLERSYTKEEIINMYLNKFDFLYNAVGIQSAASVYFGTSPSELTVEQAATLIGMCKNPAYFNPVRSPQRTQGRRNTVLDLMHQANYISKARRDSCQQIELTLNFSRVDHKAGLAPYFREHLRLMMTAKEPKRSNYRGWQTQEFVDDSIAWATNPLYGWCNKNVKIDGEKYNIYTDGLKIYTTIDSRMQRYAEEAVQEHIVGYVQPRFWNEKKGRSYAPFSSSITQTEINEILDRAMRQSDRYRTMKQAGASDAEIAQAFNTPTQMSIFSFNGAIDTIMSPRDSIRYQKSFLRTGFMSMEPITGHVKAYVGGTDFHNFQYDMVSKGRRQVGSTIKPYLYTLAMEEGFSPCDLAPNTQPRILCEDGTIWEPRNASDKKVGEMVTLSWGLTNSNNWISAYLIEKLSPYNFARLLRTFGLKNQIDPVMSLCLGPAEVSVSEMVSAYTAFANKGVRVDPIFVTHIEDNHGNIVAQFTPQYTEVFSETAHEKILPILENVINEGTGVRLRYKYKINAPMGGKTGTTNNNSDGWFMGFTPELVSGTWVGGEDRSIHFDRISDGQGASLSLPIYALYMQKVYGDPTLAYSDTIKFDMPEGYNRPCEEELFMTVPESNETIKGIFD